MKCRTRSAALLAALLTSLVLLASVATAHAEGEWVLWLQSWALGTGKFKDGMPMTWTTVTGTNSSGQCDQVRQTRMQEFAKGTFREADHMLILDTSTPKVDYKAFADSGAIDEGTRQKWESKDREKGTLTLTLRSLLRAGESLAIPGGISLTRFTAAPTVT